MSPYRLFPGSQNKSLNVKTLYDLTVTLNSGEPQPLSRYRGKVLLIVNVASECGFTPQYQGLEQLYAQYRDRGLEILAFPCNQFGHQERGSDVEIRSFCDRAYHIHFPLFSKLEVNGPKEDPLYTFLKGKKGGLLSDAIKWNFTKFLISRDGSVVRRYAPSTAPREIAGDIETELEKQEG